jgi:hypothetical protein
MLREGIIIKGIRIRRFYKEILERSERWARNKDRHLWKKYWSPLGRTHRKRQNLTQGLRIGQDLTE